MAKDLPEAAVRFPAFAEIRQMSSACAGDNFVRRSHQIGTERNDCCAASPLLAAANVVLCCKSCIAAIEMLLTLL